MISKKILTIAIVSTLILSALALIWSFRIPVSEKFTSLQTLAKPGDLSHVHAFIEHKCSSCHSPVDGVTADKCIACHAGNESVIGRQPTEFHVSVTNCQGCHMEHKGYSRRPTEMSHEVLVNAGINQIKDKSNINSEEHLFAEKLKALISISSDRSDHYVSAKESVLNCNACHSNDDPHRGLLGKECSSCHTTKKWNVAGYKHPSVNSKDCAHCHEAPPSHYMKHFHMVSKKVAGIHHAKVEECYKCHQSTSWNDIKNAGWYKHH